MELVKFEYEDKYVNDFINLPRKLYDKNTLMEDKDTMKSLLLGKHSLNKYFTLDKYLIYDDDTCVGRFIFTKYPDDNISYLGFFEVINDNKVAKFLFDQAYSIAKREKRSKIVGPVDASFWLKYRLKINMFDKIPYTGEPYNKDYYFDMFKNNKYKVVEHYTSNIYEVVEDEYDNKKFTEHFIEFEKLGYVIKSPVLEEYEKTVEEVYYLITDLYSDFPIFKNINKDDFMEIFKSYKMILNLDMVKMAYYNGKNVGFFISVPNYNNLVYNLNLFRILKVLKLKKKPREFVMLYMGTDQNHKGLGKALAFSITNELKKNKLPSIGALARDGKITQNYAEDKIENRYEYVLLERLIK